VEQCLSLFFLKEHVLLTIVDKSPWDHSNAIFMFFCNSGCPFKTVHPFRNVLAVLLPHTLTKVKKMKKIWIHVPNIVLG